MSEFQQEGLITTIHGFYDLFNAEKYTNELEDRLMEFSRHVQIGLLLPSLFQEIHVPKVLDHIIDEINQIDYLSSIVVALGGAEKKETLKRRESSFTG